MSLRGKGASIGNSFSNGNVGPAPGPDSPVDWMAGHTSIPVSHWWYYV